MPRPSPPARPPRTGPAWPVLALLACAGCDAAPDRAAVPLVIISPHRDEIRYEVQEGFQDWLRRRPGWAGCPVRVEWRDIGGGTSQIIRFLYAQYEKSPDGVGIDLLYGGGTDIYLEFKDKGLLERFDLPPELAAKIPQNFRGVDFYDPDGRWYGVMLSSLGIQYNRDVLDRLGMAGFTPSSWKDLGDERLLGRVSAGDPRMSGSVRMLYELILQTYGWDDGIRTLMRLGANARGFVRFSDSVTKDVVFGRAAAGGSLDSYGFSALTREGQLYREGKADALTLGFVFPRGETLLNPDSIGILKGAPQLELARLFVEYNLSEEGGQRLWALQPRTLPGSPRQYAICRLSVVPHLYDPAAYPEAIRSVQLNPFDERQIGGILKYDNKLADGRRHVLNDLFGAWVIDTHPDLHRAWAAVVTLPPGPRRDALAGRLFAPPCSEAELKAFGAELRKGPRERAELLARWIDLAQERYRAVAAAARGTQDH